jgi:methionyl-tRNA formyltransferase
MARFAFFGTPEFALPSLMALHRFCVEHGHDLAMVVSQPDRPSGRGQKEHAPPVKERALSLGIPVFQPETLKKSQEAGESFFQSFVAAQIDVTIVVAYGKLIPERILHSVNKRFVNIHASLLPRFRGAAPIQRAIACGDKESGVCLMEMTKGLDEGDVYALKKTVILASDTAFTLSRRLANLGAYLLSENLANLLADKIYKIPQSSEEIIYAPMLDKSEGHLDFKKSGSVIAHEIRAFDPWPTAFAFIRQKRVKFFDSFFIPSTNLKNHEIGTIIALEPFLGIKTHDGVLYVQRLQVEGKKVLAIKDALLGFPLEIGDKIT